MKWFVVALVVIPVFLLLRRWQAPRRGTERLGVTVNYLESLRFELDRSSGGRSRLLKSCRWLVGGG
jgi:hypothetical protein